MYSFLRTKETNEQVSLWFIRLCIWDDLRNCIKYYKKDFFIKDYIDAVHIYREFEEQKMNERRLEQFKLRYRLYDDS